MGLALGFVRLVFFGFVLVKVLVAATFDSFNIYALCLDLDSIACKAKPSSSMSAAATGSTLILWNDGVKFDVSSLNFFD